MDYIIVFSIFLIIGLILSFFVAKECQRIAKEKGFSSSKYFWWTFWVLPVGMAMVIALPDLKARGAYSYNSNNFNSGASITNNVHVSETTDDLPEL